MSVATAGAVCAAIVVVALAPFPIGTLIGRTNPSLGEKLSVVRLPALALAASALVWCVGGLTNSQQFVDVLLAAVIGACLMLAVDFAGLVFLSRYADVASLRGSLSVLHQGSPLQSKPALVAVFAAAAAWEEFIFRLLPFLAFGSSAWYALAVLFSSLLFSLQHLRQGRTQMIYSFCLGVCFSLLLWYTGSIWSAIAAHFVGNLFTSTITKRHLERITQAPHPPF